MTPGTAEKRWIAGVDLGGTNIVVGLIPIEGGEVLGLRSQPTDATRGAKYVVDRMVAMVDEAIDEVTTQAATTRDAVAGVGIGSPGPLDRKTGTVINTPNLGWRNFPLRDLISNALKLPCTLDNDANCATYGEWWLGAGRGTQTLVGITLGTGIGGGIVLNGEIFHGCSDVAGEIGHMTIDSNGRRCKCGNYGCLEQYASGPAIALRAMEGLDAGAPSMLIDMVGLRSRRAATGVAATGRRMATRRYRPERVPLHAQGRSVPGRGLHIYPEGESGRASARIHADRFCLYHPHRSRSQLRGRKGEWQNGPASPQAA